MKKLTLKQILAILLAAVTLLLASCTPDEPAVDTTTTEAPADDDTTTTDGGDGETTTAPVDDPVDPGEDNIPTVDSSKNLLTFTPGAPDKLVLDEEGNCAPIIIENYNEMAIDDLGRALLTSEETGLPNSQKWVGLFYSIWTCTNGSVQSHTDVTKALACNPENPYYGSYGNFCWWSEPETGYHIADDVWQIRRDMRYFAMSGVDFLYLDFTNSFLYENGFEVLLDTMAAMRAEGQMTPYIVPWALDGEAENQVIPKLYNQFYSNEKYDDLWFYWEGKPLILLKPTIANNDYPALRNQTYLDTFTFRIMWVNTQWPGAEDPTYNLWYDGMTAYGGYSYGWHDDPEKAECVGLGVAGFANPKEGRSGERSDWQYLDRFFETKTMGQGINLMQGFKRIQKKNPEAEVLIITRWNEWTAQTLGAQSFGFVDQFNTEFSRDIEPMKGGFTDNYFYQMCNIIREFKGVLPAEGNTGAQTMNVNTGDFEKWEKIYPIFTDYALDTKWRNSTDPTGEIKYVNSTGRHDIVESRLTADGGMVYAYVRCAEKISSYNRNPNWMMLFIDADQNKETGWEGYDFVINYKVLDNMATTICAYKDNIWQEIGIVQYKREVDRMMIAIPRSLLGLTGDQVAVDFHWMDNVTDIYDLHSWFTTGDSAPERRNNYTISLDVPYNASAETVIPGRTEGKVEYMPAVELTAAQESQLQSGLNMSVYSLPENYGKMPDIEKVEYNKIYTVLSKHIVANGGFKTSNYAIAYDGYVKIPEDGEYRFRIACDDGALLYIDGRLVAEVPYDAERGAEEIALGAGNIRLAAGYHTFRLEYAETGNGNAFLALDGDWELSAIAPKPAEVPDYEENLNEVELELDLMEVVSGAPIVNPKYVQAVNHGTVFGLGKMDLSIYSQVEISYCSDAKAKLGDVGSFFALTYHPSPIHVATGNIHILAQGTMENASGSWDEDIRTVTIDLSEVAYDGNAYLAVFMADNNGVKITSIKFTKAATPTPKPEGGLPPMPEFDDMDLTTLQGVSGNPTTVENRIEFREYGTVIELGNIDLSAYERIEIMYGSDEKAKLGDIGTYLALTKTPDPITKDTTDLSHILVRQTLTNASGSWAADIRTASFDLSSVDHTGTIYLAYYMASGDGINIYTIRLIPRDGVTGDGPSDGAETNLDLSTITEVVDHEDNLPRNGTQFEVRTSAVLKLDGVDLSKYAQIEITYGSDKGATFDGKFMAIVSDTTLPDSTTAANVLNFAAVEDPPADATSSWVPDRSLTLDLPADGDVYLAVSIGHGINIYTIRLIPIEAPDA